MLITIQVVLSVLLSILILVQTPTSSLNLSTMGGGIQGGMKKRWATKFLHVSTIVISVLWVVNAIVLFLKY